jgi:ligand-binding sensor domain-containing protein
MRITLLIIVFFLFSSCRKDKAKNKQTPPTAQWEMFDSRNSLLPDDQINALAISQADVKWIGTSKGIALVTGSQWSVFTAANSPLLSSFIRAVATEPDGTVWIGTDHGLARFDGQNWLVYTTQNSVLPNNGITAIVHDKEKHITWVGTEGGLVSISNNHWKYFDDNNSSLINPLILSLALAPGGTVWLGTFDPIGFVGRLWSFNGSVWSSQRLDTRGYPSSFPHTLAVDSQGAVWLGVKGTSVNSLIKISGTQWGEVDKKGLVHGVSSIALDGTGKWIGGRGLSLIDPVTGNRSFDIPGRNDAWIFCIAVDQQGNKWLGSIGDGVMVLKK